MTNPLSGRWKPILRRVAVVLMACTLVPVALLYVFQDRFVFVTDDPMLPASVVLPDARDLAYTTADGVRLTGWFVASRRPPPTCGPSPAVVLFHGQGGNRSGEYPIATALADRGVSVLLAEYRGFAGMEGSPSEDAMALDAQAAFDALAARPDVDSRRIIDAGFSLGTGVAIRLATARPVAGVVLLAPFTSLPDIAWSRLPVLPYGVLMRNQFDSRARIGSVQAPVLVVVGSADDVVPNDQSSEIYRLAQQPQGYVVLAGRDHLAVDREVGTEAGPTLGAFIDRNAACSAG